jgi:NADH:ubiquinone oxidoreductase subunit F (NADH-binding)/ferredoxin
VPDNASPDDLGHEPIDPLDEVIEVLRAIEPDMDATCIAETVWLAALLAPDSAAAPLRSNFSDDIREEAVSPASPVQAVSSQTQCADTGESVAASRRGLYEQAPSSDGPGILGRTVRAPHGRALPRALEVARSMRPFKRPWVTGRESQLDLKETIDGYSRSLELIPVFRPAPERWFELVVVVDRSISMAVWQETVFEFTKVLRGTGAFRQLHVWDMDLEQDRLIFRGPQGQVIVPEQMKSPDGRRLTLIVSDCSSEGWYRGLAWTVIRKWAHTVPIALVNPLPSKLWRRTGLDMPAMRVDAPATSGSLNSALRYETPFMFRTSASSNEAWTPLPALTMTPYSLGRWARTLMRIDRRGCDAVIVPDQELLDELEILEEGSDLQGMPRSDGEDTLPGGQDIVDGFLHIASPEAVRLAVLCAPYQQVGLPLLHLIREELVPEATASDEAEVVVSGLFTVSSDQSGGATLRFREGTRARLKNMLSARDAWLLHDALSRRVARQAAVGVGFPAVTRDSYGDVALPADAEPFAEASMETLRLLGVVTGDVPAVMDVVTGDLPAVMDVVTDDVPTIMRIGAARLTAGLDRLPRLDLKAHRDIFGPLPRLSAEELIAMTEQVDLRGHGGEAFPFARKLSAVVRAAEANDRPTVVVVNATEGEPGSVKDKMLMIRSPYLILSGAALVAQALGAEEIVVGVVGNELANRSIEAAIAAEPGLRKVARVVQLPDRLISGESGALIRGINGKRPVPPITKMLPSESGVDDLPTLLSNASTLAQLAILALLGPERFAAVGTPEEPGTILLSVGGSAAHPAVVEVPSGVPLGAVLDICQAPTGDGVLVGGYHGMWLPAGTAYAVPISREGLAAVGGTLGSGIVLPLGDRTCPLGEVSRIASYLAGESAGQCGPCKLGLPAIARALAALVDGSGGIEAIDVARRSAAAVVGRGACSHPDGVTRFVLSALDVFTEDLAAHAFHSSCGRPVEGVLPLPVGPEQEERRRLVVDWTRCEGHGLCAHLIPELIHLDAQGYPVILDIPVPSWLEKDAQQAVHMCPTLALRLSAAAPSSARTAPVAIPAPTLRAGLTGTSGSPAGAAAPSGPASVEGHQDSLREDS